MFSRASLFVAVVSVVAAGLVSAVPSGASSPTCDARAGATLLERKDVRVYTVVTHDTQAHAWLTGVMLCKPGKTSVKRIENLGWRDDEGAYTGPDAQAGDKVVWIHWLIDGAATTDQKLASFSLTGTPGPKIDVRTGLDEWVAAAGGGVAFCGCDGDGLPLEVIDRSGKRKAAPSGAELLAVSGDMVYWTQLPGATVSKPTPESVQLDGAPTANVEVG